MKQTPKQKLITWLDNIAAQMKLPPEDRDDSFEDGGVPSTIELAAKYLRQFAPEELL